VKRGWWRGVWGLVLGEGRREKGGEGGTAGGG